MERSSSARKGRGISVSLSSKKSDQAHHELKSVRITPFQFISNHAPPIEQKIIYHRPSIQIKDVSDQKVNFSYSNINKESQIREGILLDREINELRKELAEKKNKISQIQNQIYKEKSIDLSLQHSKNNFIIHPRMHEQSIIKKVQKPNQIEESNVWEAKVPEKYLQNKVSQNKVVEEQKPSESFKNVEIKNLSPKKSKASKVLKKDQEKQNCQASRKQLEERYEQLKWAEEKVLDLIRVCEHGL